MAANSKPQGYALFSFLGGKLLRQILALYLFVAAILTLIIIFEEYRSAQKDLFYEIILKKQIFVEPISHALWELDMMEVNSIFQGMLQDPDIVGIKLVDPATNKILESSGIIYDNPGVKIKDFKEISLHKENGLGLFKKIFSHTFACNYHHEADVDLVGEATIYTSSSVVVGKIKSRVALILLSAAIKTIALWIIFLFVCRKLLIRPLTKFLQEIEEFDFEEIQYKSINLGLEEKNELTVLAKAFNGLTSKLAERARLLNEETKERVKASKELKKIEWLLKKSVRPFSQEISNFPPYGNLLSLNNQRLILDSVGEEVLKDIVGDFLDLLDSSSAIYEINGDYAFGIFSSGWCSFLDNASRNLCKTSDNQEALNSGLWLCHESCWTNCSKVAIETGQPVDIECHGGIHLYAVPIFAGQEIIGAINFGYGNPPLDKEKLAEIAEKYRVEVDQLSERSSAYEIRPQYILDIARKRIFVAARLIGAIVTQKMAEKRLQLAYMGLEQQVKDRTQELARSNEELVAEIAEREKLEDVLRESNERYKQLFESAGDPIFIHDVEARMLAVNQQALQQYGYSYQEIMSLTIDKIDAPEESQYAPKRIAALMAQGYLIFDAIHQRKDGSPLQVEVNARRIIWEGRQAMMSICRNITERKKTEAQLQQYAETQAVLLREVNHRVKNNLTSIISMLHQEEDRAEREGKTEFIMRLNDVNGRIQGLLTVHSLLSTYQWQPLELSKLCEIIIQESVKVVPPGIAVTVDVALSKIKIDSDQAHYLAIVLSELATNSTKYAINEKKAIMIKVSLQYTDAGREIELLYQDNGAGYAEPILRGEVSSTCIGVNLISGITRKSLRGNIEFSNNNGAMARITFPKMV